MDSQVGEKKFGAKEQSGLKGSVCKGAGSGPPPGTRRTRRLCGFKEAAESRLCRSNFVSVMSPAW